MEKLRPESQKSTVHMSHNRDGLITTRGTFSLEECVAFLFGFLPSPQEFPSPTIAL